MVKVIILKKNLLGNIGDIVKVKSGYARNYLIPYGYALYTYEYNLNKFSKKKLLNEKNIDKKIKEYKKIYNKILKLSPLKLGFRCSDNGKLFGSLNSLDICNIISKTIKYKISRKSVSIVGGKIKYLGEYSIDICLYKEHKIKIILNIISLNN